MRNGSLRTSIDKYNMKEGTERVQKTLFELVNEVQDEATFLAFLSALSNDRQACSDEWQHNSIESFLEAAADWGHESVNGLTHYEKPDNPWKRCAQIMYMGKIYE